MDDTPDFETLSTEKLRWFLEHFPSPHQFFAPTMAALEKREADEKLRQRNQSPIHISNSAVANLNVGSQVGQIAAQTTGHTTSEFKEQVRQVVRRADLEWSLLNKPENYVTPQMICGQVDELRKALAMLYGKCPSAVDSQPLRNAIEKLDATKNHRVGNRIGSKSDADTICELMHYALAAVSAMVSAKQEKTVGVGSMTVKQLQEKLAKFDGDTRVVVHWEDGDPDEFFGIDDVSVHTGNPSRDSKNKPRFTFDSKGNATWLFIEISAE